MKKILNEVIRDDNLVKLVIVVEGPDKYSEKCRVLFTMTVYDEYHKEWLDPRQFSFFLNKDEIQSLSEALGTIARK